MNPFLIGVISLLCAGFIAGYCTFRRLWWPVIALVVLTAIIALQLYFAYQGDGHYHDLSAFTAMQATVIPALVGTVIGILTGERFGQGVNWRSWQGALTLIALTVALGAVVRAVLL